MFQTKEQDKSLEKDFNETEVSNLPDKEFNVIVIKMHFMDQKNKSQ